MILSDPSHETWFNKLQLTKTSLKLNMMTHKQLEDSKSTDKGATVKLQHSHKFKFCCKATVKSLSHCHQ